MTGGTIIDIVLVLIMAAALLSGFRQGAVASALALIGVVLGLIAGVLLSPHLIRNIGDMSVRRVVGIALLVALVIIGVVAGMVLGTAARSTMRMRGLRIADSVVGALLQVVAVIVAAFLLAIPLSTSAQPNLVLAVKDSRVLQRVDAVAPDWLRKLPDDFGAELQDSGIPQVIAPFGKTPVSNVEPPDPQLARSPVVDRVRASVVRIEGIAQSCDRSLEGTGFVISPGRVMTNAHVVAGTNQLQVQSRGRNLRATVVVFDPQNDIAILDVPGLAAPSLRFADGVAASGSDAIAIGFPEGGPYTASPERIRERVNLEGPDIYRSSTVNREVYTLRGLIRRGNSGGPLLNTDGQVVGVVFGAAVDRSDTGFALTASQVQRNIAAAAESDVAVSTGSCVND